MKFDSIINNFVNELSSRLSLNIVTSEDNVRYYFVDAIKQVLKIPNNNIVLEQKYNNICKNNLAYLKSKGLELDLEASDGSDKAFIEIKYHKNADKSYMPTSQNVGEVINDLLRLSLIEENGDKLLVYVMENIMEKYIINTFNNKYFQVLTHSFDITYDNIDNLPITIKIEASKNLDISFLRSKTINVIKIYDEKCEKTKNRIIVYKVLS